jgi:hypothetical protein
MSVRKPLASTVSTAALLFGCMLATLSAPRGALGASDQVSCAGAGPQAPRDVTMARGSNRITFAKAPPAGEMHLCDIHFHKFAEHRASGFLEQAGEGNHRGYVCNGRAPQAGHEAAGEGCQGISIGDTIEVHWVFTTCDVAPAPTLDSCFTDTCQNPQLRVEARVFYLTDDAAAAEFGKFAGDSSGRVSLPQAERAVEYLGATTGDKYNDGTCSPFQVTWNVSSVCRALELQSINAWCGKDKNAFKEDHAHGVRQLVTAPELLAPIQ